MVDGRGRIAVCFTHRGAVGLKMLSCEFLMMELLLWWWSGGVLTGYYGGAVWLCNWSLLVKKESDFYG